ncbi:MAG: redoxin domain-containing protein [Planctomycetes bacterium]|nr:redoxin domain-containing protein [Planctomycetota bacterium]
MRRIAIASAALFALGCDRAGAERPGSGEPPAPKAVRAAPAASKAEKLAPDFTLKDVDGNAVTLSSLRGRPVVLSFWFLG